MKKFDIKSIVVGLVIGIIGSSIIFATVEKKNN
jgi:ABC-type thiamin/hydroxymethylpyrimidine transport system permease subunit